MTLDERLAGAVAASPELASFNMGSMNLAIYPMLKRHKTFIYDWEAAHLEATRDFVFRNTFKDMEQILARWVATTGHASSSSARTSGTCTTWPTSWAAAWSSRRSSSRPSSGSSAELGRMPTTSST